MSTRACLACPLTISTHTHTHTHTRVQERPQSPSSTDGRGVRPVPLPPSAFDAMTMASELPVNETSASLRPAMAHLGNARKRILWAKAQLLQMESAQQAKYKKNGSDGAGGVPSAWDDEVRSSMSTPPSPPPSVVTGGRGA